MQTDRLQIRGGEPWFDVKAFGAKGDGVTDDTAAFLTALRSADAQYNSLGTAQAGRVIYVPQGTYNINTPLYLRKGDLLQGDGGTASRIQSMPGVPFTNLPLLYMGFKSDGTQDSGGLEPVVDGIFFAGNTGFLGNGIYTTNGTSRYGGWSIRNCWFATNLGILAGGTDGIVFGNTFDTGTGQAIKVEGDGTAYGATHSILIENNRMYTPTFAGIWIDGANDIQIIGNYFDYCKQYGIYFANTVSGGTTYNVRILGNHFTTSGNASFYTATQTDIDMEWPLENVEIIGNSFSRSRKCSINFGAAGLKNITCSNNQYQDTNDTAVLVGGAGVGCRLNNETFRNVGNYAIDVTGAQVEIRNCFATGVFAVAGLPANNYDQAAFRIQNASGNGSIVSNCSTDSTTYGVAAIRSGATSTITTGNRSNWATSDVIFFAGSGTFYSWNERATNPGGNNNQIVATFGANQNTTIDGAGKVTVGGGLQTNTATLTSAAPTVSASQVGLGSTTATSATAGANGAVPAQVAGYLIINVAGTAQKIPYFNT